MKKLLFVLLLSFSFSGGYAAYLVNVPQTLKQPDGTVLHCFASGDEFYHWLHDSLGYTIVADPQTGYFVYAVAAAGGQIAPSGHIAGIADPVSLGLPVRLSISKEIIEARRADFVANLEKDRIHKANGGNNIGTINNLVIFIRFADETTFSSPSSLNFNGMKAMFNDSSSYSANSMYNFYRLASYGQLYIVSHFYPVQSGTAIVSYQDINPRSYYQPKTAGNPDGYTSGQRYSREAALLARAAQSIASSVPADLDIDYDGDGNVDNVAFLFSGAPDGWSDLLWPHRYTLSTPVKINGKYVHDYNFLLANTNYGSPWPGVLTHEMMHSLSAPDLYRYTDDLGTPVGSWDLMGSTTYGKAQGLGAHMKWKYGKWIPELPEVAAPGTYTLYPVNDTTMIFDAQKSIGYRINLPGYPNEYLVLEYRKTNACTFENSLPGSGIVIYRIRKNTNGNASADGSSSYDEVYVFRPNGKKLTSKDSNGNIDRAHFSAGVNRTVFDPTTNPYPFFCDGSHMTGFSITNITAAGDSIQFTYAPKWDALSISKEQIAFGHQAGNTEAVSISANTAWTITGVDTSWLSVSVLAGDSGTTNNILFSTRTQNSLRVPKTCTLLVQYGSKEKYVSVSQGMQPIVSCQDISNRYNEDTLAGYNFQQQGVTAVSEYFASPNILQVIDSVAFYFGNITLNDSADNTVKLEIYTSNASNRPGNTELTQTIPAASLTPNAWNTIHLQKPVITSKGLTVGYSFVSTDSNFLKINIFKNAQIRTETYNGTMIVKQNGSWRKSSETAFPDIMNYSLAAKLFVCPPSPSTDTLLVSKTHFSMPYDSIFQDSFAIASNVSWEIVNFPEGFSISQSKGTGNATVVITPLSKNREAKKTYYFWVRSGSILHNMTIERATYPLISSKKEVELNYEGTDSAEVFITAIGTSWTAQTNCAWLRLSRTSGNAGSQKLVIYPTGENTTNEAFEGCVDIISTTLNESMCIVARQNSIVGVPQMRDVSALSLFPNPATSQLTVNNGDTPIQTIIVYNMLGKEVLKKTDVNNSSIELNLADLYSGIYFVKVTSAKSVQVKKFVKD